MTLLESPPHPNGDDREPAHESELLIREARQRQRRRWLVRATALAVIALSLSYLLVGAAGGGSGPTQLDSGRQAAQSRDPSLQPTSTAAFRPVATGVSADRLDCVSVMTCFAIVSPQPGDALRYVGQVTGNVVAKTVNGGASWLLLERFPRRWSPHPVMSCPTSEMCAIAVQAASPQNNQFPAQAVAVTTNGGDAWKIRRIPLPAGVGLASVNQIACHDASHCVATLGTQGAGYFFLSTSDAGVTWTTLAALAAPGATRGLRCDPDGRCIVMTLWGLSWHTLTSIDGGLKWSQNPPSPFTSSSVYKASCGDPSHCVYSTMGGGLAFTQNGGATWALSRMPGAGGQIVTGLDCVNASSCYAAVQSTSGQPVLYRTQDAGLTWNRVELTTRERGGGRVMSVAPLSCATKTSCIGMGAVAGRPTHWVVISNVALG
jgi:photosystem II stability/assembly factor-like uncharacterized protein